jgi:hypothetical protein
MKSTIFIPKLCKVGFNERSDTYTGVLGYVIYNDGKVWRKENSWESWREKYISPEEEEQKKLDSYNRQMKNAFDQVQNNNKRSKEYWWNREYVDISGASSIEDIMKLLKYEEFDYRGGNESSNEKIKVLEFNNEPLEGFVLNKKSGGDRYGWNPRQTYCRVYDPRGFEFEITIPNLLYILENTNSIKGKGLEGKFIYGWSGKDLVLVPENAPEFESMMKYTKLQDGKVLKKEMKPGNIYLNKSGERLVYMGDFNELQWRGELSKKKKLWFFKEGEYEPFLTYSSAQSIKADVGEIHPNFAGLMDKMAKENKFYPFDTPEYELIEDPLKWLENMTSKGGSYNYYAGTYIKTAGDKFTYADVNYNHYGYYGRNRSSYYSLSFGKHREEYKSLSEISNKYKLWRLKMTR